MNKKRILKVLSLLIMLALLAGCTIARNEDGSIKLITLSTTFSDMTNEGIFSAILVYPLAQAINYLSNHLGVGLAVMIVTLLLNGLVLAFTFKSNVSMQRIQDLQPEVAKIQKKYEGRTDSASQQRLNMELTKLYQNNQVNPITALVVAFLQFPVLFAMYSAVQRSAAVAQGTFLGVDLSLTPAQNFANGSIGGFVFYGLMLVLQFLSIFLVRWLPQRRAKKLADKQHRSYEKPKDQNAMVSYGMIIFIGVLMLSWPSALSLYYAIYSLVQIIKTLVIEKLMHKE